MEQRKEDNLGNIVGCIGLLLLLSPIIIFFISFIVLLDKLALKLLAHVGGI
jgi:hypothetical protein